MILIKIKMKFVARAYCKERKKRKKEEERGGGRIDLNDTEEGGWTKREREREKRGRRCRCRLSGPSFAPRLPTNSRGLGSSLARRSRVERVTAFYPSNSCSFLYTSPSFSSRFVRYVCVVCISFRRPIDVPGSMEPV